MQYRNSDRNKFSIGQAPLPAALLLAVLVYTIAGHAQALTSLSISPNQPSVSIGATTQLTATARYSDGSSSNVSGNVSWSSSDPHMVSVSSQGVASGLATGNVAITANYNGQSATTTVSSSIGSVTWSGPITITQGGTYSGNWKSTDPNVPAVLVNTTEPVVIQNSYVTGPNDLIDVPVYGNSVTVKNVIGIGVNPNVKYQPFGTFVDVQNPIQLDVENCYFENVRFGVYVRGYAGNRNGQTITVLNNRGRNMQGVESDGNNGTLAGESYWQWSHAIQIGSTGQLPRMQIAWNEIVNYPSQSMVNENVNLFDAGGTSGSPTVFHDNYIQGAFPYNPYTDAYNGGGFTTDGGSGDTVSYSSSYINIYNNQIVGTVNMGIEIGTGHDNAAYNNRVISSGLLPNGAKIPSQNVGIAIYDVYGNLANGSMYNNTMYNNTVGWMCWAARCAWDAYRNDEWFPLNGALYGDNTNISANQVTLQMENDEYQTWLSKVSSNGQSVGPTVASSNNNSGGGNNSGSNGASGISTTAWYSIVNSNSSLCLDDRNWNTANGAALQQFNCAGSQPNQLWQFQSTGNGYYRIVSRYALNTTGNPLAWDVTGGPWATANQTPVQLWTSFENTNQQWMPVALGNGAYKFVVQNSSKCLDVPGASTVNLVQLQQYDCNGTGAQSFTLQQH